MNKLLSTMLFVLLALVTTFGQDELFGKYTLTDNPGSYLILHALKERRMMIEELIDLIDYQVKKTDVNN